jgi:hypothetical protein
VDTQPSRQNRVRGDAFVGRDALLEELADHLDRAREGAGRLVVLAGEPGIGKTRTATELVASACGRGMKALVGRCHEDAGSPAYWPWRQVLRELVRGERGAELAAAVAPALRTVARIVPDVAVPDPSAAADPDDAAARFRLFDDVTAVLAAASAMAPLLVVLDDVQWADEASLRLVQFVARDPRAARLLVLATCRDPLPDLEGERASALADVRREASVVDLRGLDEAAVGSFLAGVAGRRLENDVVAALHRRTAGNPLFMTEIVRLLGTEGRLDALRAGDVVSARLPSGVRHVILRRLAALAASTRDLLVHAAAVGNEFEAALVERVLAADVPGSPTSFRASLAEAVSARLIDPVDPPEATRLRFTHALAREALYAEIPEDERTSLHARIATALEALPGADASRCEELAFHYARAAAPEPAIAWAARAGEGAMAAWAYDDAAAHFRRALAILDGTAAGGVGERRCDLTLALGAALARAGRSHEARGVLKRAADDARTLGSPERLAAAALSYPLDHTASVMSAELFDPELAKLLEDALAALGPGDDPRRARLTARLASAPGRGALASEAVAIARRAGDPAALGFCLSRLHWVMRDAHPAERAVVTDEVVRLAEQVGNRDLEFEGRTARLRDLLELGERTAIDLAAARHLQLADALRQPSCRWTAILCRALQAFLDGDFPASERWAGEALAVGQSAEPDNALQAFAGQLGTIRREQARLAEVEPQLTAIAAAQPDVLMWRAALAFVHSELGHHAEARALLDGLRRHGFERMPHDNFWLSAMAQLADAIVTVADAESAAALYPLLAPYADRHLIAAGAISFGAASRFLGMLATLLERWDEARAQLEHALASNRGLRAIPWIAHTQVALAHHLLHAPSRDAGRAATLLAEAEATARAHDMTCLLTRIAALREPAEAAPASAPAESAVMRREGEYWTIVFAGRTIRLRDVKGLRYLAALLVEPGRELHVFDLLAVTEGTAVASGRAPGGLRITREGGVERGLGADARVRAAYGEVLRDLELEASEAEAAQDLGRAEQARARLEALHAELAATYGLRGQTRRAAASPLERARKAVYNRVTSAIARLDDEHVELARHLTKAVRTGTTCVYLPARLVRWDVVA